MHRFGSGRLDLRGGLAKSTMRRKVAQAMCKVMRCYAHLCTLVRTCGRLFCNLCLSLLVALACLRQILPHVHGFKIANPILHMFDIRMSTINVMFDLRISTINDMIEIGALDIRAIDLSALDLRSLDLKTYCILTMLL